jgi:ankyrin repeat protein
MDQHGNTPLHIACYQGHPATVRLLLKWGAGQTTNKQERTPLDLAGEEEEEEVVSILEEWIREHPRVSGLTEKCFSFPLQSSR